MLMNDKDAEKITAIIGKEMYELFISKYVTKPNTVEYREAFQNDCNAIIMQQLNSIGMCNIPVDVVVNGNKNELKIYFVNKETGEVLENIEELEEFLKIL